MDSRKDMTLLPGSMVGCIKVMGLGEEGQYGPRGERHARCASLSRLRAGLSHMEFWSLFQCFGSHRFVCPNDAQGIGSRTKQNRSGNGCCVCPTGPGWKRSMHPAVFPYAIPLPASGRGTRDQKTFLSQL